MFERRDYVLAFFMQFSLGLSVSDSNMFRSILFIILLIPVTGSAQVDPTLRDSVLNVFNVMRTGADAEKIVAGARLEVMLEEYYSSIENFENEFDSVPFLGQLASWDGALKMTVWNIVLEDESFRYYCVLRHKPTKESVAVTVFEDSGSEWGRMNHKLVRPNDWYGALYYKILAHRYRGKTYYTLLGWDGKDNITNRKVVDAISFQGKSVMLGSSIFVDEDERAAHRLIYEYANDVSMALNYDEKEKMIVMDNLAPEDSRFEGMYQFYGPDFSYNGLVFKKGKWLMQKDVFAKNRSLNNLPEDARPGDFKD